MQSLSVRRSVRQNWHDAVRTFPHGLLFVVRRYTVYPLVLEVDFLVRYFHVRFLHPAAGRVDKLLALKKVLDTGYCIAGGK